MTVRVKSNRYRNCFPGSCDRGISGDRSAEVEIVSTLLGMVTPVKPLLHEKALLPIVLTLLGISTDAPLPTGPTLVILLQLEKASALINLVPLLN